MTQLLALGAPKLRDDCFYRVTSNRDGFVWVEIRQDVTPSWRNSWQRTHRVCRVLAPSTYDYKTDIREGCEAAVAAIAEWEKHRGYWDGIKALEGDHR
jgi:hypothetical protein